MFYSYGNIFGYDKFTNKIGNINERSIFGCILLSFIALILNFFFPLNAELNTFILILGLIFLYIKKSKNFKKKEFYYIIISSILTSLLVAYSNVNRPDAGLYHLPYTNVLNESKIIIGLSNIHFRFGASSIMQYLSAINNNLIFKEIGVVIPLASIMSFFILFFFNNVFKIFSGIKYTSLENIFSLFVIIFLAYKVNRYSSFGNDAVAHLSFFYLISKLLSNQKVSLTFVALITIFAFLNKTTLIILILIPIIIFLKDFKFTHFKLIYSFPAIFLFLWILKNMAVSGCMIYPIKETCFKNLNWVDIQEVKYESISGEAWAKDWPNKKDNNISMENYNIKFNWLETWSKNHGKILAQIVLPYFILIILLLLFISKKKNTTKVITYEKSQFFNILLIISLIGSILFFMKFPLYRYGYSYLISSFLLSIFLLFKKFDQNKLIKTSKIIFVICVIIFSGKQMLRYSKNFDSKFIWPKIYSFDSNEKIKPKKINISNDYVIYQYDGLCMYSKSPCTTYKLKPNLKTKEKLGYRIIYIENN